jgi:hypothetical protein
VGNCRQSDGGRRAIAVYLYDEPSHRVPRRSAVIALPAPHPALKIEHLTLGPHAGRRQHCRRQPLGMAARALDMHKVAGAKVADAGIVERSHGCSPPALIVLLSVTKQRVADHCLELLRGFIERMRLPPSHGLAVVGVKVRFDLHVGDLGPANVDNRFS